MKQKFYMPKLGLTMTEGLVAEWSLAPGARFKKDQTVYVVETDKAANEIAAEFDGVLLEIVHAAGATVPVGEVLAYWDDGAPGGDAAQDAPAAAEPAPPPAPAPAPAVAVAAPARDPGERIVATPLARRMAGREGIDLAQVAGSGPRGRIKAADVESAKAQGTRVPVAASAAAAPQRVPISGTQQAMAKRLAAVKQEVPHFYLAREADVGALRALRAQLNESGERKFTLNHFIVAALGRALVDEPQANRVWDGDAMLQFSSSDVGVAVNTERGLFVPVVRDAGRLPLGELSRQTQALVERARGARLSSAEMSGGAVTVSNAGMFNVTYMTPIINPGQAMILGVGSVRETFRPDRKQRPVLHSEMGLVLACDHRVLDGVSGLRFLSRVAGYLEKPLELLAGA